MKRSYVCTEATELLLSVWSEMTSFGSEIDSRVGQLTKDSYGAKRTH